MLGCCGQIPTVGPLTYLSLWLRACAQDLPGLHGLNLERACSPEPPTCAVLFWQAALLCHGTCPRALRGWREAQDGVHSVQQQPKVNMSSPVNFTGAILIHASLAFLVSNTRDHYKCLGAAKIQLFSPGQAWFLEADDGARMTISHMGFGSIFQGGLCVLLSGSECPESPWVSLPASSGDPWSWEAHCHHVHWIS